MQVWQHGERMRVSHYLRNRGSALVLTGCFYLFIKMRVFSKNEKHEVHWE